MRTNRRAIAIAVLAGFASGSLGGPRERTVVVPTARGAAVYRTSGLEVASSAGVMVRTDKRGRSADERGHVLTNRVVVRYDDRSRIPLPRDCAASVIAGLDGYLLIDAPSVGDAVALARRLRRVEGVRNAYVDIARPNEPRGVPTDPFVELEWHFRNIQDPGIDASFLAAWQAGYDGAGVVVGVVERLGVESTHPDIAANYNLGASLEARFVNAHPTAVGGIIAMVGNNGIGGAGGAHASQLSSITTGVGAPSEVAIAFLHRNDLNDIKNNSWGPRDDGRLDPIDPIELDALREGVASGRQGLGEVYVWAAGNGGTNQIAPDRVDYDQYAASRYTIAVGAYDDDGDASAFNEVGSSMFVCAPSGGEPRNRGIFTTDLDGEYTDRFSGSSASAPIASAAIALMLEANPELGWRDVQHILVESARIVGGGDEGWRANGSGRLVHYSYGYGSVDAGSAVAMAETWRGVGEEAMATTGVVPLELSIPDGDPIGVEVVAQIDERLSVEAVELVLNIAGDGGAGFAGDLDIRLVSPAGFESILALPRDDFTDGYRDWTFTSVRHWGESSEGAWMVRVADEVGDDLHVFEDFELRVFGGEIALCPADLTGTSLAGEPGYDVPDGDVDADDFFRYLDLFAAGDARADLTGSNDPNDPGYGEPDGVIDGQDFFFFLGLFSQGCS